MGKICIYNCLANFSGRRLANGIWKMQKTGYCGFYFVLSRDLFASGNFDFRLPKKKSYFLSCHFPSPRKTSNSQIVKNNSLLKSMKSKKNKEKSQMISTLENLPSDLRKRLNYFSPKDLNQGPQLVRAVWSPLTGYLHESCRFRLQKKCHQLAEM